MPSVKRKEEFLAAVCSQIRFKRIHHPIADELAGHIDDLADEYAARGMDENTAAARAVSEMGDPVEVGKALDRVHRPRVEWSILGLAAVLVAVGIALQGLLIQAAPNIFGSFGYVALYTSVGIAILFLAFFFGPTLLRRLPWVGFALLAGALIAILYDGNRINSLRLNAYYIALLLVPVYAAVLERLRNLRGRGIALACVLCAVPALLLFAAPHSLAALFWCLCCLVLLTSAVVRGRFGVRKKATLAIVYGLAVLLCGTVLIGIASSSGYRSDRLRGLIDATVDPNGSSYLFNQLRALVAAAKPFGSVLPAGSAIPLEWKFIVHNPDFSLTYILFRFGTLPAASLVLLFGTLLTRMLFAVRKLRDESARLQSLAVLLALGVQIVFYALFNFGVVAPMGATLPFVSFGALSCFVNMALLGLLLSHYRLKDVAKYEKEASRSGKALKTSQPLDSHAS